MALISQAGLSYCVQYETVRCKAGHNVVYGLTNNIERSKVKESFFSLPFSSSNSSKPLRSFHIDATGESKRGHQVIVAASPPTEDAVVAAEPLTKEDLVGYLASGCKPKEKWRFNF